MAPKIENCPTLPKPTLKPKIGFMMSMMDPLAKHGIVPQMGVSIETFSEIISKKLNA